MLGLASRLELASFSFRLHSVDVYLYVLRIQMMSEDLMGMDVLVMMYVLYLPTYVDTYVCMYIRMYALSMDDMICSYT